MAKQKIVFIAHPISGNVDKNIKKVLSICKKNHSINIIPVFPSFIWRQYLGNSKKDKKIAFAGNLL